MCALALHNPSVFSAHAARDIVSSVPFQKIIYYNSMYSAVWWVLTVVLLLHQVRLTHEREANFVSRGRAVRCSATRCPMHFEPYHAS